MEEKNICWDVEKDEFYLSTKDTNNVFLSRGKSNYLVSKNIKIEWRADLDKFIIRNNRGMSILVQFDLKDENACLEYIVHSLNILNKMSIEDYKFLFL